MAKPLRMLLVEDSERDAALLMLYLRRGGYAPEVRRVDTRAELRSELRDGRWDIVVSDFNLPGFDAFAAMADLQASGRSIPFVVLSGELAPNVIETITAAGSRFVYKYVMREIVPIIDEYMRAPE
ncbi:MAG TPA: response regulator [Thermoanaerobaculia bacterium]|nr:response regulator [Thermoanaerobaculia bacterium]